MSDDCIIEENGMTGALAMARQITKRHKMFIGMVEGGPTPFVYSIGLFEHFLHPEIIICGLHPEQLVMMLNNIRDRVAKGGAYEIDQPYDGILHEAKAIFKPVHTNHWQTWFGFGVNYYNQFEKDLVDVLEVVQMFWPDREGLYPWEENCILPTVAQPLLYEPVVEIPPTGPGH